MGYPSSFIPTIYEESPLRELTGLLTHAGVPIYRITHKDQIGFIHFPDQPEGEPSEIESPI